MNREISDVLERTRAESNPLLISNIVDYFVTDSLRADKINLYEAYLLNFEIISLKRKSYLKPAWNGHVQISTCVAFVNQIMLAYVFDDLSGAQKLTEWGIEAHRLNKEKRRHYIMDRFTDFLAVRSSPDLLRELSKVREAYKSSGDNNGPYHIEVFPYHFFCPEDLLLSNKKFINQEIEDDIVDLIVELNLKE